MAIETGMYRYQNMFQEPLTSSFTKGAKMGDFIKQRKKEEQINKIIQSNQTTGPDGQIEFNRPKTIKELAGVDAETAMKFQDRLEQKDDLAFKRKQAREIYELANMANELSAVKDHNDYIMARKRLAQKGINTANWPAVNDPGFNEQFLQSSIPYIEQWKAQQKEKTGGMTPYQAAMLGFKARQDQREQDLYERGGLRGNPKFISDMQSGKSENFLSLQNQRTQLLDQREKIQDAFQSLNEYTAKNPDGTGKWASGFGLKAWFDKDLERLDVKFKKINLDELRRMAEGMAKAFDSEGERRSFEQAQSSITNDERTNAEQLLNKMAATERMLLEADAQKAYVEKYGDLDKYESPIGKLTTLVDRAGQIVLVPKEEKAKWQKRGYKTTREYARDLYKTTDDSGSGVYGVGKPRLIPTKKTNEIDWAE